MYVLTVDQRGSRRDVDRVADLLDELRDAPMLRKFERTAGDEVQAVSDDPGTVVDLALALLDRNHWSIGIGIGPVETPLPPRPAPVAVPRSSTPELPSSAPRTHPAVSLPTAPTPNAHPTSTPL